MARWLVMVVLACGCRQLWGLGGTPGHAGDAGGDDVASDGPSDHAGPCYGSFGNAPYCSDVTPQPEFGITSATTIDTTIDPSCLLDYLDDCVIIATNVDVDAKLSVTGLRPLVLIATETMRIGSSGHLDTASHPGVQGAGGSFTCFPGANPGAAAGGAGGSFGARGGNGGTGVGSGGISGPTAQAATLRGGCPGETGGTAGGAGGDGGGAVYLIAMTELRVDGDVTASGAGGAGGTDQIRGGGGGGSGGMIVLESAKFTIQGSVFANGGGGGGGSDDSPGHNGDDPTGLGPASGGAGGTTAGAGGNGSGFASPAGANGVSSIFDGGGGGGGGAGVIKTFGGVVDQLSSFSPVPS